MLSLLVAMSENHVIGENGKLPWHLPSDLKYFKQLTMGKTVVMGRRTYMAIGKPLRGRTNIVLTRDRTFSPRGCEVVHDIAEIVDFVDVAEEVFVIGGANVFAQVMPYASKMYLTIIRRSFDGDVHFYYDEADWEMISCQPGPVDSRNPYPHDFCVYERK
ncbi:dihydrofolate reductase [Alicyclobacillus dauci]|uniref:Dihydrofolate reductase n=1 Tax=Alicyclobacillus dauci TaxID=1475485 RepID=A0ABY6Z8X8_9BACL|nr:dihydrofolate reductase [Alicyclobacillus dauci]